MQIQISLPATLEDVSLFSSEFESKLHPLPVDVLTPITLAVHELLVNIVRHAYAGQPGDITLNIEQSSTELNVVIMDAGANAFAQPDVIAGPDLSDLPESGMGLFIIHQAFNVVEYTRTEQGNRWQLVKTLGG